MSTTTTVAPSAASRWARGEADPPGPAGDHGYPVRKPLHAFRSTAAQPRRVAMKTFLTSVNAVQRVRPELAAQPGRLNPPNGVQ